MEKKESTKLDLGVLQGRIFPNNLNKFNKFPNNWEKEFEILSEINLDFIELLYDGEGKIKVHLSEDKLNKTLNNSTNIHIYSANFDVLRFYDFNENLTFFLKELNYLYDLGVRLVVLPFIDRSDYNKNEIIKALKSLNMKFDKDMKFSIESEKINFLNLIEIVKSLPSNFAICYDTGNYLSQRRDIFSDFKTYKDHISHIHLKAKKIDKNKKFISCYFDQNKYDLKKYLDFLIEHNYKHKVVLESYYSKNGYSDLVYNLKCIERL